MSVDLSTWWLAVNLHFDELLNTPLIADPSDSYIAITGVRVLVIGLVFLLIKRIAQLLRTLPPRQRGESLRAYLRSPWWRTPAVMIACGFGGIGVMLFSQTLAGNLDPTRSPLGNLTPYSLLANGFLSLAIFGVTLGAGAWRRQAMAATPRMVGA